MAKLQTTLTSTVAPVVEPALVARISAILSTHAELKVQADLLYDAMEVENKKVFALLEEAGIEKTQIDGIALAIVRGHSSKLDKVKFVELGGSLAQLENATSSKPKKAYLRIGKGGEGEE